MLREAVASVTAQSFHDWELIIVDDGSDDSTWQWVASQGQLQGVRHSLRKGPAAARNAGAQVARGRYLAFLDSDDLFLPRKLELQVNQLDGNPNSALSHGNEIWMRHGQELKQKAKHEKRGGWIFEHCLPLCRISPSAALMRLEVFEALGGFDEELEVAEDYELWLRLTCQHHVAFIEEPLLVKRGGHGDQLSMKYGQIEKFRIEALRRVLRKTPLKDHQFSAALCELEHKCKIYALGCEKRGRLSEAQQYLRMTHEFLHRKGTSQRA